MDKEKHMDTTLFAKQYWDERVSILLVQLAEYEKKSKELDLGTKEVGVPSERLSLGGSGRWQNLGTRKPFTEEERVSLKSEIESIGNAMKFDNPYVWIKYKGLAYSGHANTDKRMDNLSDFVRHMEKEVICPKRFEAVNKELRKRYGMDLTSGLVPLEVSLPQVADYSYILELSLDPHFISLWCAHEYDAHGKWVKWDASDEHGGAKLARCC